MHAWVAAEERRHRCSWKRPFALPPPNRRRDVLNSWKYTILDHARDQWRFVRENFFQHARCYGADFLKFIADDWKHDTALNAMVADHVWAVERGLPRPPEEKWLIGGRDHPVPPARQPWLPPSSGAETDKK